MKHTGYAIMKGDDLRNININTKYIIAYGYNEEADKTIVWFLGVQQPVVYLGNQVHTIKMAIEMSE